MSGMELIEHRLGTVEQAVGEIRDAIKTISESLHTIAGLEQHHAESRAAIERAFHAIGKMETEAGALEVRVRAIEIEIPGLRETRKWVISIVLGVASLVGVAVIGLVVIK